MDSKLSFFVLLLCYVLTFRFVWPGALLKAEYDVIFERIQIIAENESCLILKHLKVSKFNRTTTVINGTVEFRINVTERLYIDITGYEQYGFSYRRSIIGFRDMRYCDYARNTKLAGNSMSQSSNLSDACPIPAGVYYIRNFYIDGRYNPTAVPRESKWYTDLKLHQNAYMCAQFRIYFRFERKPYQRTETETS